MKTYKAKTPKRYTKRNPRKARIADALYRMRKQGFAVPANIRELMNLPEGVPTYEEVYTAAAPHVEYIGKGGLRVSGQTAYEAWAAARQYNVARTKAIKKEEKPRDKSLAPRPLSYIGPTAAQLKRQGVQEEDIPAEIKRKTEEELQQYTRRWQRLTEDPLADIKKRANAHRKALNEVMYDLPLPPDMRDAILGKLNSMTDEEINNFFASPLMSKVISAIYLEYKLKEGQSLEQAADLRSSVGGYLSPLQFLINALGLGGQYGNVAEKLTGEHMLDF